MIQKIALVILLSILTLLILLNKDKIDSFYIKFFGGLPEIERLVENKLQDIKKEVNTPPPLRAKKESPSAFLTISGVINFTNIQRVQNGLSPLTENSLLNLSAAKKAQDMFEKQYFEHNSPEGLSVGDLAEGVGYEYIVIGENLALGNFLNDADLVQAWMDSPGHRANILNGRYKEIGVAVIKGAYEGKNTWMAVQHFGRPLSDCPSPDNSIKQSIENNENRINQLQTELETKKKEIDEAKSREEHNQKAEEYNKLIEQYNNLVAETKSLIEQYNNQVKNFNQCAT